MQNMDTNAKLAPDFQLFLHLIIIELSHGPLGIRRLDFALILEGDRSSLLRK